MTQTREVVQQRSEGITPSGKTVVRESTQVSSPETDKQVTVWSLNRLVYYIVGVMEAFLVFRFVLKILGANPSSPFVSFIYSVSGLFVAPFRGIFSSAVTDGLETVSVFEPATLFAILVYIVIAVGIVALVNILTATDSD